MRRTTPFYQTLRVIAAGVAILMTGTASGLCQNFETGKILVCTNKIGTKTDQCKELAPPFENIDRRIFSNKRIDFKLTIYGQDEALSYLRQEEYLPVKISVKRDGFRRKGDISADIKQTDWDVDGQTLINQVSEEGRFSWRTFFHVNLNNARTVEIQVNDAGGNVVLSDRRAARMYFSFAN